MTQDEVSDKLGLTEECKRRTMTRYEKGKRNPKNKRTVELAKILNVDMASIKNYNYKDVKDIIYTLMWLEELIPNYHIDLSDVPKIENNTIFVMKRNIMRNKRSRREISYKDYIEWKLNYEVKEDD